MLTYYFRRYLLEVLLIFGLILITPVQLFSQLKINNTIEDIPDSSGILIDANYTTDEALEGSTIPSSVKNELRLVTVQYFGYDDNLHQGQLIINKKVADDIIEIFNLIEKIKFPVQKVVPLVKYNWSDEKSMEDNNTSGFNYRFVSGTKILSMHANGLAIDINPKQNPYIKNGKISPEGSEHNPIAKGTITADSEIVDAFKSKGWLWGGDWKSIKDYQHFQKVIK